VTLPAPAFIGFFPKATQLRPDWLQAISVKEIGSVSHCISKAPDDWIKHWKHNALGFYDSKQMARTIIGGDPERYDMYAYEMFPFRCLDRKREVVQVNIQIGKLPQDFEFLGYDMGATLEL